MNHCVVILAFLVSSAVIAAEPTDISSQASLQPETIQQPNTAVSFRMSFGTPTFLQSNLTGIDGISTTIETFGNTMTRRPLIAFPSKSFGISLEKKAFGNFTVLLTAEAHVSSTTSGDFSSHSAGAVILPAIRWYASSWALSGFWFEVAADFGYTGGKSESPLIISGLGVLGEPPGRDVTTSRRYEISLAPAVGYTKRFDSGLLLSLGLGPSVSWEQSSLESIRTDSDPRVSDVSFLRSGIKVDTSIGYAF